MNFEKVLVIAVVVTAFIWLADIVWRVLKRSYIGDRRDLERPRKGRWIVEYARAFFPVLLVVLLLRSFVVEPFRIPSGSMLPTLEIGDFILVKKYQYGVRLPLSHKKIFEFDSPKRGDVMVFRFPHDNSVNFIKRVIGLPGDRITYDENKSLRINGEQVTQDFLDDYLIPQSRREIETKMFQEAIGDNSHQILKDEKRRSKELELKVPDDTYFVLGDNRDYSNDSRFWGFVPESNVIGQAFLIWFSWDTSSGDGVNWSRIAEAIE